jgi:hypothetical protein
VIRSRVGRALAWRFGALTARLDVLNERLERLELGLSSLDGRIADQLQPMLRAVLDEESQNRRRLFQLRGSPAYLQAYSDPDPLVSITVPTVGRVDALVTRSLPSLLAQSHANLEVLVVGDATAAEVEQAVTALADPRVRFANLSQRLLAHPAPERHWLVGSAMARNEATRRASGRWLLHFDDDDHLRPDAIATLLELAREQRAEVAYGGTDQHYPDGSCATLLGFPPAWGSFTWPAALVHGGLRFFERELAAVHMELPGDIYMLERMLRVGVRFAMLDEVLLDYYPSTLWKGFGTPGEAA